MASNWEELENNYGGNFKPYIEDGKYDVALKDVTMKTASTGTIFFEFNFEEDENVQYPKVSRAFFKDEKKGFRMVHYRNIMMVLGATKENAQKAVDVCEGKANREAVAEAYTQTFNRLSQKHPKVSLEVSTDVVNGKEYARGEFGDRSVHFSNNKKTEEKDVVPTDIPEGEIDLDEIPF